jgi:hypothetical protein
LGLAEGTIADRAMIKSPHHGSEMDFNSRVAQVSSETRRAIELLIEADEARQRR